jgi:hypothetical protein
MAFGSSTNPSGVGSFIKKSGDVPPFPRPYWILRLRLIEDASVKYFVGQLTSAIVQPRQMI